MSFRSHLLRAMTLCVLSFGSAAWSQTPYQGPMVPPGAGVRPKPAPIAYVAPRPWNAKIAKSAAGTLSLDQLRDYAATGAVKPLQGENPDKVAALPLAMLKDGAQYVVARQQGEAELLKSGNQTAISECNEAYEQQVMSKTAQRLYQTSVASKVTTPSQEVISTYFTQHKAEFVRPAYFKMRHMILYTYQPYIVKADDKDLESIAKQVNGDVKTADMIRSDVEQRPLRREAGKEFKPLVEGEKLLVPMNDHDAEAVKKRLDGLLGTIKQGTKFEDLATTYSDAETKGNVIGPLPSGTRPILPELLKYGFDVPVNDISPIFRTKHGWNVIQVTERKTTETPTLNGEVQSYIVQTMRNQQQNELIQKLLDELMAQPGVRIHTEVFKKAQTRTEVTSNTVVYEAGTHKVRWSQIERAWAQAGSPVDEVPLRNALKQARDVVQANILHYADRSMNDADDAEGKRLKLQRTLVLGETYIGWLVREDARKNNTDSVIEQYYEANKAAFKLPPLVAFDTMMLKLDAKAAAETGDARKAAVDQLKAKLEEKLKSVKSAEEFTQIAREVNQPLISTPDEPPHMTAPISLEGVQAEIKPELIKLEPGKWSAPFEMGEKVASVLLMSRTDNRYRSLAEARPEIQARLESEKNTQEARDKVEAALLKRANYEFVLQ
jgi:parvulin-like peptidyl-prolyl isomerase